MKHDEFSAWLEYHTAAFRELIGWFGNMADNERSTVLWDHWFPALESIAMVDAKAATDRMFRDESGKFASLFAQTPANVRRIARLELEHRLRKEGLAGMPAVPDDKQPRYRCLHCEDGAWVSVLSKIGTDLIRAWGENFPDDWCNSLRTHLTGLRCLCQNSVANVQRRNGNKLPLVYDPTVHCRFKPYDREHFREWLDSTSSFQEWIHQP